MKKGKLERIEPWSDDCDADSRRYIETAYGMYAKDKYADAWRSFLNRRAYNPLIDLVDNLNWDGENRCEHFLHTWLGVEDTEYSREVSRLIFAGGIHRLYAPGTKFDDVPILIGTRQGEGKSSIIRWLAINDQYYGECVSFDGQHSIEQLSGKWICEVSEMLALTKSKEQEAVKAYLSRMVDSYRKPYDRTVTELPRRCIFIGTTNQATPLVDKTGNRRFYPVTTHTMGYDLFDREQECREYIMQCWAEARERYKEGKMPNYADRRLADEYIKAQRDAMQDDWRVGAIESYLEDMRPGEVVCVRQVKRECLSPNPDFPQEPTLVESKDIGMILDKMPGWERIGVRKTQFGKQKCWRKLGGNDLDDDDQLPVAPVKKKQNADIPFWEEQQ